jgi:hypothetical protein
LDDVKHDAKGDIMIYINFSSKLHQSSVIIFNTHSTWCHANVITMMTTLALKYLPPPVIMIVHSMLSKKNDRVTFSFPLCHMIQVDIGGHPPFPNGSKQFSGHFGNLLFLAGFNFGAILRA